MSRVQLALNVNDIDEAVSFYTRLFGTEPAKRRPGYANFAIAEPPLKLVLLENPGQGGTLNHLGVEVADAVAVDAEQARLAQAGLAAVDERDTTCCYARQDKFWVTGAPGGERWEIYTVLADSPTFWGQDDARSWEAVEAALDAPASTPAPAQGTPASTPAPAQATQCCGGPQEISGAEHPSAGACCA
jgi:catechol 2,3-dioxygenase-like lactoylglutathione lyase family enzyme